MPQWFYVVLWLILALVFFALEAATVQLVSIWLAVGSLAALVVSMLNGSLFVQIGVCLIVTGICLVFTRPFFQKVLAVKKISTNADRAVGSVGIVTEDIEDAFDKGRVTVDGLNWKARSANGETLPAGTRVTVREMQGVTLTVEKAP